MSLSDITEQVSHLGYAWEQFKQVNERRLKEIEQRGHADSVTQDHLGRINDAIDQTKSRLDRMETTLRRPSGLAPATFHGKDPFVGEYRSAFCNYLRKGIDHGLQAFESKALSAGSDTDGGYLVTPSITDQIIQIVHESSPMRQLAAVASISSDSLELIEDKDETAAGWTSETGSVSDSATPTFGKKTIPVHELYAQPKATQKLIDDAAIDIEAWLADKVGEVFARKEGAAFISGTGTGQPRGILTYDTGTSWGQVEQVKSGVNGVVTADSLISVYYALKSEYASRASFLMHRSTIQAVRLLKEGSTNQYLWQPGLSAGAPDTLLGVPVIHAADMPIPATGSLSVAVGDFSRAYQIVDRTGIRVLRDPFTDKPFVKFYTTMRVGGDVVNFEAIKLLKLAV
jgi:HK97 family phage major capsid protein